MTIVEYMGTYYYGEDLDDIILNMVSRQDGSIEANIHYKDIEYSLVQYILQPNELTSEPMGLAPTFWNDLKAVALQTFSEYDIIDFKDFLVASEHIATRAPYDKFRDITDGQLIPMNTLIFLVLYLIAPIESWKRLTSCISTVDLFLNNLCLYF